MRLKIIEVNNLTKRFGKLTAVNNLSFTVYKGDVFGFLGPNGAGKSTTIRMLLSLIKPSSGSINIFGQSINSHRKEILGRIGAIVEKPDFYLYLTAYQNLQLLGKISGKNISPSRINEMLRLVGLASRADSEVKSFSHGMKQRLGIAQALLHDPELIILDEPTTGLDPQGMKEIRELIIHLSREKGKTIFLSSHILKEIEEVATRLLIINNGTTQVEGEVEQLLNQELSVRIDVDNVSKALKALVQTPWESKLTSSADGHLFFSAEKEEVPLLIKQLVEAGINITAVIPRRSLEDFFLKITEAGLQ